MQRERKGAKRRHNSRDSTTADEARPSERDHGIPDQPIPGEDGQTVPATEKPYKTDGATVTNRRSGQIRGPVTGNPYRMKPGTHTSRDIRTAATAQHDTTLRQEAQRMTKQQYAIRHGLTVRPVTDEDTAAATTDYQRRARYIIDDGGRQWYSLRGSMRDMRDMVAAQKRHEEEGTYV